MIPVIVTPKVMSASAKKLAQVVNGLCVLRESKTYKPKWNHFTINWGCSKPPNFVYNRETSLNFSENIGKAINKLETFKLLKLHNIPHPEWTTDYKLAKTWEGAIVGRSNLTGFGGKGIILCDSDTINEYNNCLLFVKYQKKKNEYRVHVFNGSVIDITQKKKRKGVSVNTKIRNYQNGWVYCRDAVYIPEGIELLAIRTIKALNLHFGAVDIIWNELQNKCYVLEVNTAPGLTGTTLKRYADAIKERLSE